MMLRRLFESLRSRYGVLRSDLLAFSLVHFLATAGAVVSAKALAMRATFDSQGVLSAAARLPRVIALDLILLGAWGMLLLATRRLPQPRGAWRLASMGTVFLVSSAWTVFSFVNAAFLVGVGASLNNDLLQLAPDLGRYFVHSVTPDTLGLLATAGGLILAPIVVAPMFMGRIRKILDAPRPGAAVKWLFMGGLLLRVSFSPSSRCRTRRRRRFATAPSFTRCSLHGFKCALIRILRQEPSGRSWRGWPDLCVKIRRELWDGSRAGDATFSSWSGSR